MTVQEVVQVLDALADEEIIQIQQYLSTRRQSALAQQVVQTGQRIAGLHAGLVWVSDDFDEPLPDDFWFGEDE